MSKKQIVDLVTAIILIIVGSALLIVPILEIMNVKVIFMVVLGIYGLMNLIQFILTRKDQDYEGLFTMIASLIVLIMVAYLNVSKVPWYLALALFTWIILMALIKLKKADYYNDRKNKVWILKVITLILFVLAGLLTTINLYYSNDIQILVLGFFFLVHGMLELFDPLTLYLLDIKKEKKN